MELETRRLRVLHVILVPRHVTMHRSDWPELFELARTKESAQRYQTTLSAANLLVEVVDWERDYIFAWFTQQNEKTKGW